MWFLLFQSELEDRFMKSMRLAGGQMYIIIGNDCFLNMHTKPHFDRNKVISSTAPGPFHAEMDTYYNVIDDHIITMRLAKSTAQRMETLYMETKKLEGLNIPELATLFMKEGKCTLTLEKNAAKAARMRRRFSLYFGRNF